MLGPEWLASLAAAAAKGFASAVGSNLAAKSIPKVAEKLKRAGKTSPFAEVQMRATLEAHLVETESWSGQVQFFGMSDPEATYSASVGLDLSDTPRQFRPSDDLSWSEKSRRSPNLSEESLLYDSGNFVLLGDPGAGKTTTVKRLVRRLLEAPNSKDDPWAVPITVVLREQDGLRHLYDMVFAALGLYDEVDRLFRQATSVSDRKKLDTELLRLLAFILNSLKAVLLVDGLDELDDMVRNNVEREVGALARMLQTSKMIVSCRSGDYSRVIEGFRTVEICELSLSQVTAISERWLKDDASIFLDKAQDAMGDLSNRPLFLCQAIVLFKNTRSIPQQPFAIARQMTRLMLQDWDRQRRIKRPSRYAHFDVDQKFAFLANLAFVLMFELKAVRFEHDLLVAVYDKIRARFLLPANEADQVARELETHTGIIVACGPRRYEFSHLSIEEYLAAEFLVRTPDHRILSSKLQRSPATVAVAVALSSEPNKFFAATTQGMTPAMPGRVVSSFVSRLLQERPYFTSDGDLAGAVLKVLFAAFQYETDAILSLLQVDAIGDAIVENLSLHYDLDTLMTARDGAPVSLIRQHDRFFETYLPERGTLGPRSAYEVRQLVLASRL